MIPDTVVVITTTEGEKHLERHLHTPIPEWKGKTVWQALRQELLGTRAANDSRLNLERIEILTLADAARGVSVPLPDIRTPAENNAAGEKILEVVRRYTTDPETRVIALLAGGRKTMSALLHSALSLAGRDGDRLLHVLVSAPFDQSALEPLFYFPGQPGPHLHRLRGGDAVHDSTNVAIDLTDVPFAALGDLIFNSRRKLPATFGSLMRVAREAMQESYHQTCPVKVSFDPSTRTLEVNGLTCQLPSGRPTRFTEQIIRDALSELPNVQNYQLHQRWGKLWDRDTIQDLAHAKSEVRKVLEVVGVHPLIRDRMFPSGNGALYGLNSPGISVQLIEPQDREK